MRYVLARRKYEISYKLYVTDELRRIDEHTAALGDNRYMAQRWAEQIKPQKIETRTPEEIIEHMKRKIAGNGGELSESI